jgi:hypothetical protein
MIILSKKNRILFSASLLIVCGALCVIGKIFAQESAGETMESLGISVDQAIFSFDLSPGEKKTFKINVKNTSNRQQEMSVGVQDFFIAEDNEVIFDNGTNGPASMQSWISGLSEAWSLMSAESKELQFSINVPIDAVGGSRYAAIMINAAPESAREGTSVNGRMGIYVLVNVAGEKSGSGKLVNFKVPLYPENYVDFVAEFENDGTVHYIPHGEINIKNFFTKNTEVLQLEKHFVFPGKKYNFVSRWNVRSKFGIYSVQISIVDGDGRVHQAEGLILGRYSPIVIVGLVAFAIFIIKAWCVFYRRKKADRN